MIPIREKIRGMSWGAYRLLIQKSAGPAFLQNDCTIYCADCHFSFSLYVSVHFMTSRPSGLWVLMCNSAVHSHTMQKDRGEKELCEFRVKDFLPQEPSLT